MEELGNQLRRQKNNETNLELSIHAHSR